MRDPHEMPQEDLAELVAILQRALYLELDPKEVFIWNPEKNLDCESMVAMLDELMGQNRLHPAFVELKKPFVHRPERGVEYEGEALSGPLPRNPELAIPEGRLIGHLAPNFKLADIVFGPTLSKLILLRRGDVEHLRELCDKLLEFMRE